MGKLPLGLLQQFVLIARQGNLSRAAREANLTVSALSHQMKQLEERLDRRLFERGPRGVTLTVDGSCLLEAVGEHEWLRRYVRLRREWLATHPNALLRNTVVRMDAFQRLMDMEAWALPLPTIDPQVVARSAAALPGYGPDFRYTHHAAVRHLPVAVAGALGTVALVAAAQLPPLRAALSRLWAPGRGPSAEQRARGWFTVRFEGRGGGERVVTEVSGGDPGYTETATMLAESALCLAFDELPHTAGQVTTAVAMGPALIDRLTAAGLRFTVLDTPPAGAPGR